MSSEPEMSDAQFTNVFSVMIGGLILLTIALIILAAIMASDVRQSDLNAVARDSDVAQRIEPAGQITVGEAPQAQAAASSGGQGTGAASGEAVYQNNCAACHASGVAGAPVHGEASAWSDRISKGVETLYQHAINGFQGDAGMMPAKGGNTSLSDEAVKAAVDYMVNAVDGSAGTESASSESASSGSEETGSQESGSADTASDSAGSESTSAESGSQDTAGSESEGSGSGDSGATDAAAGETVYQNNCSACHATGVAGAPKLDDSQAWSARVDKGEETLYSNAINGFQGDTGVMPPKGGFANLSDAEVKAAVDYMLQQSQ